jgi:hypothetical protein
VGLGVAFLQRKPEDPVKNKTEDQRDSKQEEGEGAQWNAGSVEERKDFVRPLL